MTPEEKRRAEELYHYIHDKLESDKKRHSAKRFVITVISLALSFVFGMVVYRNMDDSENITYNETVAETHTPVRTSRPTSAPVSTSKPTSAPDGKGGRQIIRDYFKKKGVDITESSDSGGSVTQSRTVYITPTGKRYHKPNCRTIQNSCRAISLDDAIDEGYTPCQVCNP